MSPFIDDKIKNEKKLKHEDSSIKFINVPLVMFAFLLGFGATYIGLQTNNTEFNPGDSRTATIEGADKLPDGVEVHPLSLEERIVSGQKVFEINCQACHQADGMGVPGSLPPLAGSEWVNGPAERMAAIVLHGVEGVITVKGNKFDDVMPTFNEVLTYDEIADVMTYVRQAFGNKSSPVSKELVLDVLKKTEYKAKAGASWNGEKELNSLKWD